MRRDHHPERAFLGTDRLTVAIPLKTEAASGRPVVAQEDFAAFNLLADLARDLQLEATAEYIPIGGGLDLNRDNLIVICGPRLSPRPRRTSERSSPWLRPG